MTTEQKTEKKPIKYEEVTIKVPKEIMSFLRFSAEQNKTSLKEEIENDVLGQVRAEMEAMDGQELIAWLGVGHLFYDLLGDEHYKPGKN